MTTTLDGSRIVPWPDAESVGPASRGEVTFVTLWLRGRGDERIATQCASDIGSITPARRSYADRAELARETDTSDEDVSDVERFLNRHHLNVSARAWRSLTVNGTIGAFCDAFGTKIHQFTDGAAHPFFRRVAEISLPSEIAPFVRAVVGLDEWPAVHAMPHSHAAVSGDVALAATPPLRVGLTAREVEERYAFPTDATGRGQMIGILRFGGVFSRDDFEAGMAANGVPAPRVVRVNVETMPRDRADAERLGGELAMDVQVAGSLAPGATLVLYGTSHGERGFLNAIATAVFDATHRPSILSISYGWREAHWTTGALHVMDQLFVVAALVGISVFVASGDDGEERDRRGIAHVLAPAASRFVHACGATALWPGGESAWPKSGGGFSAHAPRPPWQDVSLVGRGVPDIAAQVVPGYLMAYRGAPSYATGTSAVAPMMAALTARLNERLGVVCGFFAPLLYARGVATEAVALVASGPAGRYRARDGWSASTGLGTPSGRALLTLLGGRPGVGD